MFEDQTIAAETFQNHHMQLTINFTLHAIKNYVELHSKS